MAVIRKEDQNREKRRRALKGYHCNIYTKKYKTSKERNRAIKLSRGLA